ncbi:hypothetical protein GALL_540950 [mine drainage metagenome]|uniref:Uncharacterized protein n=1 Tax=mine drainage metagenome TaxID=410659 RepID=A0A1J5NZZ2_9ZZZZ
MAVFDFGLDQRVGADAPVAGHGQQVAVALGIAQGRVEVFGRRVHAQAESLLRAEAVGQVHRAEHAAVARQRDLGTAHARVGALDDQVHQTARRADAGLDAAGAFEDFDRRLVVERDRRFGIDRQAVAPIVALVVERVAADGELIPIAGGVVVVADAGVEGGDVGQTLGAGVLQLLRVEPVGLHRCLPCRHVAKAGDAGGGLRGVAVHHHLGQRGGLRERVGGEQRGTSHGRPSQTENRAVGLVGLFGCHHVLLMCCES